jgi:hypothetical protein
MYPFPNAIPPSPNINSTLSPEQENSSREENRSRIRQIEFAREVAVAFWYASLLPIGVNLRLPKPTRPKKQKNI